MIILVAVLIIILIGPNYESFESEIREMNKHTDENGNIL